MSGGSVRLLLFSDLMLDRPYEWAPAEIAEGRRAVNREALVQILGLAREHKVDAVVCAGNLFDRRTVRPTTMHWLTSALGSVGRPVLIAPGDADFVGPLGGYTSHDWPENVVIFETDRLTPFELGKSLTIWGAGHTQAHRSRSFFGGWQADGDGVNLALVHSAEQLGAPLETSAICSASEEDAITRAGFAHALVGHPRPEFGAAYASPGSPVAHDFEGLPAGSCALVTVHPDAAIEREHLEVISVRLQNAAVDITGAATKKEVIDRVKAALKELPGIVRVTVSGLLSPELVLDREELLKLRAGQLLINFAPSLDVDEETLGSEPTVRGQFVRDVVETLDDDARREAVLLIGLRALAGGSALEPLS